MEKGAIVCNAQGGAVAFDGGPHRGGRYRPRRLDCSSGAEAEGEKDVMALVGAVAWLAVGVLALSTLRYHRYVSGLPPSAGNRQMRRRHYGVVAFGVVATLVGLWRFYQWSLGL